MDILTFLLAIAKTFIWPLTILCVVLILRKPLSILLLSLRRVQYAGFSAEFGRQVYDLARKFMKAMPDTGELKSMDFLPEPIRESDELRGKIEKSVRGLANAAADSISKKGSDKTRLDLCDRLMELGRMASQCPESALDPNAVEVYLWMARRYLDFLNTKSNS